MLHWNGSLYKICTICWHFRL